MAVPGPSSRYKNDHVLRAYYAIEAENAKAGSPLALALSSSALVELAYALSDELTSLSTGTKLTVRAPFAIALSSVRASLTTAASSGIVTVDINVGGSTILSTKLTIDATEKTSKTAAIPAVISTLLIADDAEITFDIDVTGTGAAGLKVVLYGTR